MGIIATGDTNFHVYLTELGRQKMLEQGFEPTKFAISDADINYLSNNNVTKKIVDITGDYDDNVFSIAKSIKVINKKIIR